MLNRIQPNFRDEFFLHIDTGSYTFINLLDLCHNLAVSRFNWLRLPPTVSPYAIEEALYQDGHCIFINCPGDIGFRALPGTFSGKYDIYNLPTESKIRTLSGYQDTGTAENSVVIFNDATLQGGLLHAYETALKMTDLDRAVIVNSRAQKTPVLLKGSKNILQSLKNLYQKFIGNEPVIFGQDGIENAVEVLKTDAPYHAGELYDLKMKYWHEFLDYLGIPNATETKKERMFSDEVNRDLGGTISAKFSALDMRQEACRKINEKFGLDIWVESRLDSPERQDETEQEGSETE